MIDYKLAKELKEAGFPQDTSRYVVWKVNELDKFLKKRVTRYVKRARYGVNCKCVVFAPPHQIKSLAAPSLEELIEACGDSFVSLSVKFHTWIACGYGREEWQNSDGKTPLEAVCKLILALVENGWVFVDGKLNKTK